MTRVREKLSSKNYKGGNVALPDNASELDRAKYQLCQMIARYQREHDLLQKELAKKLGVDEARVSQILRGKIRSFTLDRLIGYTEQIYPKVKLEIKAA
jgi:predicted XRE-type DNA-binding protein